jgi:hypothetical protein
MSKTYIDEHGVIRTEFAPGEEPRVLTSVSEQCQDGECEKCPGIFRLPEYGDRQIFCIHDCHKKSNQDV